MAFIRRCVRFMFGSPQHVAASATVVIAVVTTFYAVFSLLQWNAMGRANDINAENMFVGQRPFFGF
jgi:predicted membrane-bound mannosyltransferase